MGEWCRSYLLDLVGVAFATQLGFLLNDAERVVGVSSRVAGRTGAGLERRMDRFLEQAVSIRGMRVVALLARGALDRVAAVPGSELVGR